MYNKAISILLLLSLTAACGHDDSGPSDGNETEVITRVSLEFAPQSGGASTVFTFDDPDGDGGEAPTIDSIDLAAGSYTLDLRFENGLEDPPEDITVEIADEAEEHQIFLTGTAVDGPATDNSGAPLLHSYSDEDADALPIGLENAITASAGTGELTVTLRHLPPVAGVPVKSAQTATQLRDSGFAGVGGTSDAQVRFPVTVQ